MVDLIQHFWPGAPLWKMVSATFGVYLFIILFFGFWYYSLFNRNEDRFLFAEDIEIWQAIRAEVRAEAAISNYAREIEAMQEVRDAVASGVLHGTMGNLPSGHTVKFYTDTVVGGGPDQSQDRLHLTVKEVEGKVLCEVFGPQDDSLSKDYLVHWLDEMLKEWHARKEGRSNRLIKVKSDPGKSWGVLDFLYFSAITQTTVGYGDIKPNSTAIRLLVVVQILIGLGLLVVILNLVLKG